MCDSCRRRNNRLFYHSQPLLFSNSAILPHSDFSRRNYSKRFRASSRTSPPTNPFLLKIQKEIIDNFSLATPFLLSFSMILQLSDSKPINAIQPLPGIVLAPPIRVPVHVRSGVVIGVHAWHRHGGGHAWHWHGGGLHMLPRSGCRWSSASSSPYAFTFPLLAVRSTSTR